jgi:hypothetical protein
VNHPSRLPLQDPWRWTLARWTLASWGGRWAIYWLGVLWLGSFGCCVLAQAPADDPDAKTIRQWVQELGDSQFEVRDLASAKLGKLSGDQLDLLKELLAESSDPEVIVRLSSVVAKLKTERQQQIVRVFLRDTDMLNDHGLRGWSSFAKVAGLNRGSKRLFLQLYDRHPGLVEELLEDPKTANEVGMRIVQRIQQEEMRRTDSDKADGLALLYCSCVASDYKESNLAPISLRILLRAPYNQAIRDPQSKRAIENMMELWSQSIQGSYEQAAALQIMIESNLSIAKSLAKRMLESYQSGSKLGANEESDPRDALRAFQVYFKFGKPEDIPFLEQWLDNKDVCEELVGLNLPGGMAPRVQVPGGLPPIPGGPNPPGGPNLPNAPGNPNQQRPTATVELRDVALLACMQIAGMDHRSYFKNLLPNALWGFSPKSIALPADSDAIREERLQAWKNHPR